MSLPPDAPPWGVPPRNEPPTPHRAGPSWGASPRRYAADGIHIVWTFVLAAVIAAVVLGGIALNGAMAAPSAGNVIIGGSVAITAAPGWVLAADATGAPGAIELRTADAILTAQIVQRDFHGALMPLLDTVESQLRRDAVQVSFGDSHSTTIGGHQAEYVTFEATISSSSGSGVIDGEIVCVDVAGAAVVVQVATPQGRFDSFAGDVTQMLKSLRPVA